MPSTGLSPRKRPFISCRVRPHQFHRPMVPNSAVGHLFLTLVLCLPSVVGFGRDPSPPSPRDSDDRSAGPRDDSPGIRIDWQRRLIELDATIVLREGPLELLACSPKTREHESILSVTGRPRDIYHAMGLIGLRSGSPVRYDREQKRVIAPSGESLRLEIRYRINGTDRTVPAARWLLDSKRRCPPESVNWVFAGSTTIHDGRFGADVDGTVVCVVDFDTALMAVGETHSADNDLLWLEANTKEIPPIGAQCVLVIRGSEPAPIEVDIAADGSLRYENRPITAGGVARLANRAVPDSAKRRTVQLHPTSETPDDAVAAVIDALVRAGVDRASITTPKTTPEPIGTLAPN